MQGFSDEQSVSCVATAPMCAQELLKLLSWDSNTTKVNSFWQPQTFSPEGSQPLAYPTFFFIKAIKRCAEIELQGWGQGLGGRVLVLHA